MSFNRKDISEYRISDKKEKIEKGFMKKDKKLTISKKMKS